MFIEPKIKQNFDKSIVASETISTLENNKSMEVLIQEKREVLSKKAQLEKENEKLKKENEKLKNDLKEALTKKNTKKGGE